jgi:disulfide bond formation protein DsbB
MTLVDSLVARRRTVSLSCGLFCLALVGYALYTQYYQGLEPCPLCMFQRVGIIVLGVALLAAAVPPARMRWALGLVTALVAVAAMGTAGIAIRHLYIQSLPPGSVPACGATLDYLMDVFPVLEVVRKVLTGSGECAKVDWTLLGLSMPGWVLIWSVALGTLGVYVNWPRRAPVLRVKSLG